MKKIEVKVYRWEQFIPYIEENKEDLIAMGIDAEKILQYDYKTRKMIDGSEADFPTSLAHTFVKNLVLTEARQHGRIFPDSQMEIAKCFMLENYEEIRVQLEEAYNEAKSQSRPRKTRKLSVRSLKNKLSRAIKNEDRELAHKLVDEIFDFTEDEVETELEELEEAEEEADLLLDDDEEETEEVEVELVEDSDEAPEPENEEETEVEEEVEVQTEFEDMEKAVEQVKDGMKICPICNKSFKPKNARQIYDRPACSKKARALRNNK